MSYVYINSEPGVWTVGFHTLDGKWKAESDHPSAKAAAERVIDLNGGRTVAQAPTAGVVRLRAKSVFGRWLYYPDNEIARGLCKLMGRDTIERRHFDTLKGMGLKVETVAEVPEGVAP
jgi:hypothetical protein